MFFSIYLQSDTIRLIYAYGDNDPTGSDLIQADYHGTKRGRSFGKVHVWKKQPFDFSRIFIKKASVLHKRKLLHFLHKNRVQKYTAPWSKRISGKCTWWWNVQFVRTAEQQLQSSRGGYLLQLPIISTSDIFGETTSCSRKRLNLSFCAYAKSAECISYLNRMSVWIVWVCVNNRLNSMTFKLRGSRTGIRFQQCCGKCCRFCAVTLLQSVYIKLTAVLYVQSM